MDHWENVSMTNQIRAATHEKWEFLLRRPSISRVVHESHEITFVLPAPQQCSAPVCSASAPYFCRADRTVASFAAFINFRNRRPKIRTRVLRRAVQAITTSFAKCRVKTSYLTVASVAPKTSQPDNTKSALKPADKLILSQCNTTVQHFGTVALCSSKNISQIF